MAPSDAPAGREEDLALLIDAARAAAPLALRDFRLGGSAASETWNKAHDQSLVTAADHAVNNALREILRDARPDYGWLSEEDADDLDRLERDRAFVIDPIDGTRSFAEGKPEWCLSIAIAEAGTVVAGVVFAPALDRLFAARRGAGAALNGEPIQVAPAATIEGARVLGTRSVAREEHWRGAPPALKTVYVQPLAYRLCLVAEGVHDGLLSMKPINEWDVAAGVLMVEAAGGAALTREGAPFRFNNANPRQSGCAAGSVALVREAVGRLRPAS